MFMQALSPHRFRTGLLAAVVLAVVRPVFASDVSPAPVPTVVVQPAEGRRSVPSEAVIEAVRQAVVAAQVSGRIVATPVDAGDRVQFGQVLMRIDPREADQTVAGAEATVAAARAAAIEAQAVLQRAQGLRARNFVSAAALDQALATHDAAQARLRAAEAGRRQADVGRGFATVTAPLAGVVAQRLAEVGEMAQPGRPLLALYAPGELRAVADVPEALLAALAQAGWRATVELPESGRSLAAQAVVVLPATDPHTHTARVRVMLPPGTRGVVPGMAARVLFAVGEAARLAVPAAAVLRRGELTGVYVADGRGGFVLRQVRLGGLREDGRVDVLAGLAGGETVALDPVRAGLQPRH